jgi:hypothetical protein
MPTYETAIAQPRADEMTISVARTTWLLCTEQT